LCRPPADAGAELASAVARLQARYASVSSVTATFEQTYHGPGVEQTEAGVLFMKKPGLMRWEYREPERKLFVADGRNSYLYAPEDRQVLVSRLSADELRSTPLQFLLGRGRIMESFVASWESELKPRVEGTVLLRLAPRTPEPSYAYVVLECDESTYDLRRIVIREATGNTSEFLLTNLQTNVRIDDNKFQFRIPKGVEVIRVDEK
jgi:chaperone LolA